MTVVKITYKYSDKPFKGANRFNGEIQQLVIIPAWAYYRISQVVKGD